MGSTAFVADSTDRAAPVEFRYDPSSCTLAGSAVVYGDESPGHRERFEVGAFVSGLPTAALNLQHDPQRRIAEQPDALTLTDTPLALSLRAVLRADSAEARLVQRRALRGLSVEFRAIEDETVNGVRVVKKAHLVGVGLVDRPSYPRSTVEIRAAMKDAWLSSRIRTKMPMECICQGPTCKQVVFIPGAFDGVEKAPRHSGGRWWRIQQRSRLDSAWDAANRQHREGLAGRLDQFADGHSPEDHRIGGGRRHFRTATDRHRSIRIHRRRWHPNVYRSRGAGVAGETGYQRGGPYGGEDTGCARTSPPEDVAMSDNSIALPYVPSVTKQAEPEPTPTPTPPGVTITSAELATETAITEDRAERLLAVATLIVTKYAPDAPGELLNEAVIRLVGYFGDAGYGAVRSSALGPQSAEYVVNHATAFRNSGAGMLLTRYVLRRAGRIG